MFRTSLIRHGMIPHYVLRVPLSSKLSTFSDSSGCLDTWKANPQRIQKQLRRLPSQSRNNAQRHQICPTLGAPHLLALARGLHDSHSAGGSGNVSANERHKSNRRIGRARTYFVGALLLVTLPALGIIVYTSTNSSNVESISPSAGIIDRKRFKTFTITSKTPISSSSFTLTLRPHRDGKFDGINTSTGEGDPFQSLWESGIWSVEFKQPQLQISRRYTPLPPPTARGGVGETVPGELRFLIRRQEGGEVSTYLDRLRVGALVEIRGPWGEWDLPRTGRDTVDNDRKGRGMEEVIFLAGGTGIAPAMQMAHGLLNARKQEGSAMSQGKPKITILWANRRREDCVGGVSPAESSWSLLWPGSSKPSAATIDQPPNTIVQELENLKRKFEGQIRVEYFVDEERNFVTKDKIRKVLEEASKPKHGNGPASDGLSSADGQKIILLSGPDGFIDFFAGPKEIREGKEVQGELRGLLGELKPILENEGWIVVKL